MTSRIPRSVYVDLSESTSVANGGSRDVTLFTVPTDMAYRVEHIRLSAPSNGSSGDHNFNMYIDNTDFRVTSGQYAFSSSVSYFAYEWEGSPTIQRPSDKCAQLLAVRGLIVPGGRSLIVRYTNNTGASASGSRTIKAIYTELLWPR